MKGKNYSVLHKQLLNADANGLCFGESHRFTILCASYPKDYHDAHIRESLALSVYLLALFVQKIA